MSAYSIEGCQHNCYPNTTVLVNKLDIREQAELDAVEKQITLFRGIQTELETEFADVDLEFYKNIHRSVFGDIYEWAGSFRTVNISKKGTVFCDYRELERLGRLKFGRLRELNFLTGMPDAEFLAEVTELYHELNMLHPFREGNGRTLRLFVTLLVRNTERDIDFSLCDPDMQTIAAIRAAQGDTALLREVLEEIIIN